MTHHTSPANLPITLFAASAMLLGITTVAQAAPLQVAANDSSNSVGAAIDDTAITAKVKAKFLTDRRLSGSNISVETDNGVVKLTGKALNSKAKDAAGKLASNVDGVKSVDNNINTPSVMSKIEKKTSNAASDVGQATSDTWITTKVKSNMLTDSDLKGDVSVSTSNGVVTLTGTVPNEAAQDRAVALAKQIDGVKDVKDDGLKISSN